MEPKGLEGQAIGSTRRIPGGLTADLACCPVYIYIIIVVIIIYYYYYYYVIAAECTKAIISEFAIR